MVFATTVKPDGNLVVSTNRGFLSHDYDSQNVFFEKAYQCHLLRTAKHARSSPVHDRRDNGRPSETPTQLFQPVAPAAVPGADRDEPRFDHQNFGGGSTMESMKLTNGINYSWDQSK